MLFGVIGVLAYRSFLQLALFSAGHIDIGHVVALDFDADPSSSIPTVGMEADGEEHVHMSSKYAVTIGSVIGGICNYTNTAIRHNSRYQHYNREFEAPELIFGIELTDFNSNEQGVFQKKYT